jgi:hypothetical protein
MGFMRIQANNKPSGRISPANKGLAAFRRSVAVLLNMRFLEQSEQEILGIILNELHFWQENLREH